MRSPKKPAAVDCHSSRQYKPSDLYENQPAQSWLSGNEDPADFKKISDKILGSDEDAYASMLTKINKVIKDQHQPEVPLINNIYEPLAGDLVQKVNFPMFWVKVKAYKRLTSSINAIKMCPDKFSKRTTIIEQQNSSFSVSRNDSQRSSSLEEIISDLRSEIPFESNNIELGSQRLPVTRHKKASSTRVTRQPSICQI